jgi:hypothetical protein
MYTCAVALPATFLSLAAQPMGTDIQLNWSADNGQGNDYYAVEKSADGILFETLGRVQGGGIPGVQNHYSFLDQNPFARTNYYRIKVVDLNGEFIYSDVVKVTEGASSPVIYPDPASDELNIELPEGVTSLVVMDAMGREVLNAAVPEKTVLFTLDIHVLTKGVYFLKAGNMLRKFVKN